MRRSILLPLLLIMALFGATGMTATQDQWSSFYFADGSPSMVPNPPAKMIFNDQKLIAYSWGRKLNSRAEGPAPVGKFEVPMTAAMRADFATARHVLYAHRADLTGGNPASDRFDFDFKGGAKEFKGTNTSELGRAVNEKLWPAIKLYSSAIRKGTPIVTMTPTIQVSQGKKGFLVKLTIANMGCEPITIGGPATWTPEVGAVYLPHVKVYGYNESVGSFTFNLSTDYMLSVPIDTKKVTIGARDSITLTFDVPYSQAWFEHKNPGEVINTTYVLAAKVKIHILAPSDMKNMALAVTPQDRDVPLHAIQVQSSESTVATQ